MANNPHADPAQPTACINCPLLDKPIGNGCPDDPKEFITPGRSRRMFSVGERIFSEGTPITGIHCMHAGRVAMIKRAEDEEWVVGMVTLGDILGMPDIITGEHYRNSAMALEHTLACFIPKEEALELLRRNPPLMVRLMQKVCERITSAEKLTEE
jgi:CRP/FNR family transcriptional regulator